MTLEPTNWLDHFKTSGRLPSPRTVEHDVASLLGDVPLRTVPVPPDPLEQRRLLLALSDEEQALALGAPEKRLSLARALGTQATSTARERLEADLAVLARRLGQEPVKSSQEALQLVLSRAARRPEGQTVLRVGDRIHIINPGAALREVTHPSLERHEVPCKVPAIRRLMEVVAYLGLLALPELGLRALLRWVDVIVVHG